MTDRPDAVASDAASNDDAIMARMLAWRHVRCPRCRYDLFGLRGARCPECGLALTHEAIARAGVPVLTPMARRAQFGAAFGLVAAVLIWASSGVQAAEDVFVVGRWDGWQVIRAWLVPVLGPAGLLVWRRLRGWVCGLPHWCQVGAVATWWACALIIVSCAA